MKQQKILISACLLGENVKYDGTNNDIRDNKFIKELIKQDMFISFCPEVEGGLQTPRIPVEIIENRAINKKNEDLTAFFDKGADLACKIVKKYNIKIALMKSRSPSCGSEEIYDGTFTKKLTGGDGISVKTLKSMKIKVFTENQLQELEEYLQKDI